MTKIHVLSDLHLEFGDFTLPAVDSDVLVLAGDISEGLRGVKKTLGWAKHQPVVYVPGNHEYYNNVYSSIYMDMKEIANNSSYLFILDNEYVVIDNTRFVGTTLWTDFCLYGESQEPKSKRIAQQNMNDYYFIKVNGDELLTADDTQRLHRDSVAWLKMVLAIPFDGPTVVVTHHAPSNVMRNMNIRDGDGLSPAFASNLDYMMGPSIHTWISGHTHYSTQHVVNGTRLVSNCRGYESASKSDPGFDPRLVITV